MNKLKVGDRVVVEAQVRRVDERTFTIQIENLSPIMLPHGHPSVVAVSTDGMLRDRMGSDRVRS
jgi:hypothetical protein